MNVLRRIRWLVFGSLVLSLVFIALSVVSMRERIVNLDTMTHTGPVWFMTGIEFDVLQLQLALDAYASGRVSPVDVNRQFDILWSRLVTVSEGAIANKLSEYQIDTSTLDRLLALLQSEEALIVNLPEQPFSLVDVRNFQSQIGDFNAELRTLSLDVLDGSSHEAKRWRDDLVVVNKQNTVLIGFVVVTFLILAILLIVENFQTREALKEKEKLLRDATAANVAKSQFISVMNHELRTPLTSIRGAVTLLNAGAAGDVSEKERRLLDLAQRNCEHLSSLMEDVLDIENFSGHRFNVQLERLDIADFIEQEFPGYLAVGKNFGVSVVLRDVKTTSQIEVDPKRLRQVLLNLVSNAAKFSPSGTEISMEVKQSSSNVIISVSDNGIGIPETAKASIFDPFYQVDSSDVRNSGGTGLGLSIAKPIVEGMGGEISFDSTLGHGTTFFVSFPTSSSVPLARESGSNAAA